MCFDCIFVFLMMFLSFLHSLIWVSVQESQDAMVRVSCCVLGFL
jgi:hypothetical protein